MARSEREGNSGEGLLRQLSETLLRVRCAQEVLRKAPADAASFRVLKGFFQDLREAAPTLGFETEARAAGLCERVLDLVWSGQLDYSEEVAEIADEGLTLAETLALTCDSLLGTGDQGLPDGLEPGGEASELMDIMDGLTGCFSHTYFRTRLEQELDLAERSRRSFSLALIDVDNLRSIREDLGASATPLVLTHLAGALRDAVRSSDVLARYGAEEFAVLLIDASEKVSAVVAERLRLRLAGRPLRLQRQGSEGTSEIRVTVSIGLADVQRHDSCQSLLRRADNALHAAKAAGGSRVCLNSRLAEDLQLC